jgi:small subunit ribosomal protein S16
MVKIRLSRGGRTHRPVYTIVAANSRNARDGRFLEKLGQYDPNAETVLKDVKVEQVKAWVDKGAQISDTVASLFKKNGIKLA